MAAKLVANEMKGKDKSTKEFAARKPPANLPPGKLPRKNHMNTPSQPQGFYGSFPGRLRVVSGTFHGRREGTSQKMFPWHPILNSARCDSPLDTGATSARVARTARHAASGSVGAQKVWPSDARYLTANLRLACAAAHTASGSAAAPAARAARARVAIVIVALLGPMWAVH